jgi:hypothetical protein
MTWWTAENLGLELAPAMATVIVEPENFSRMMASLGLQCRTAIGFR